MLEKSCYTCMSKHKSRKEFPCDKCYNMSNYNYRYTVQLGIVVLVVIGVILL